MSVERTTVLTETSIVAVSSRKRVAGSRGSFSIADFTWGHSALQRQCFASNSECTLQKGKVFFTMLSLIQLSAKVCSKKHETMFTLCSTKCVTQGCVKYVKETECVQELMKAQADLVKFSTPPPSPPNTIAIKSQKDNCRNLVCLL